jgi:hypothetical protein
MADSNKTKAQLLDIVKELKKKIKQLEKVEKKDQAEEKDLTETAFSVTKLGDRDFRLVEVAFDPDSGKAAVKELEKLEIHEPHMYSFEVKRRVLQYITEKVLS